MSKFRALLLSLAEPGTEGGSGGGGTSPTPETGPPPLPAGVAREKIYDHSDSPIPGTEAPPATPAATPGETPSATGKPNSADAPAATEGAEKGKPAAEDPAEKRIRDQQAAFTQSQQNLSTEKKRADALEAKLKLAEKYVDFDKLTEHDKSEIEKAKDRPVTVRDLEALRPAAAAPAEPAPLPSTGPLLSNEEVDVLMNAFFEKNPHVAARKAASATGEGAIWGAFRALKETMNDELAPLSPKDRLIRLGDAVAQHFREEDAAKEREIAERLNTRRGAIAAGDTPGSGGQPRTTPADDAGDDPATEIARRNELRTRVLRPTL